MNSNPIYFFVDFKATYHCHHYCWSYHCCLIRLQVLKKFKMEFAQLWEEASLLQQVQQHHPQLNYLFTWSYSCLAFCLMITNCLVFSLSFLKGISWHKLQFLSALHMKALLNRKTRCFHSIILNPIWCILYLVSAARLADELLIKSDCFFLQCSKVYLCHLASQK